MKPTVSNILEYLMNNVNIGIGRNKESDGFAHSRLYIVFTPLAAMVGFLFAAIFGYSLFLGAALAAMGCMACHAVNPDLDQNGLASAKTVFMRIPIIGVTITGLWMAVWGVYSDLVPHRSPISHWPVLGTLGRMVYLFTVFQFVLLGVSLIQGVPYSIWFPGYPEVWAFILIGLMVGDISHAGRDFLGWEI